MATEYKLSYTASEIDRKLATVDETKEDLANNYYKSVEVDNKFTEVNENFNTAITKKADLIDGKIPVEQLPDDIGTNENIDLSNYYTKVETDEALILKADLVDGKIPLAQLPTNIGSGEGVGNQIQVDYNQNDETQLDYIKNRPFYTLSPKFNFNFNIKQKFETISWDGNTEGLKKLKFSENAASIVGTSNFFKVSEQTILNFSDIKDSKVCISFFTKDALEEQGLSDILDYYHFSFTMTSSALEESIFYEDSDYLITSLFIIANKAGTLSLDVGLEEPVEIIFPEPGIYFVKEMELYPSELIGAYDVLNSDNLWTVPNILGEGTIMAYDKVSNDYMSPENLINSNIKFKTFNYSGDTAACLSVNLTEEIVEGIEEGDSFILLEDNESWFIVAEGIPLIASIKTPGLSIEGIEIPEVGTYLGYMCTETGNEDGSEIIIDGWRETEKNVQIDPKYIPKKFKAVQSDWENADEKSTSYIKNKPFIIKYFDPFYGDNIYNSDIKIPLGDAFPNSYYGLIYSDPSSFEQDGVFSLYNIQVQTNEGLVDLNNTTISNEYSCNTYRVSNYGFLSGRTDLMAFTNGVVTTQIYLNGTSIQIQFPQKGIYGLYHENEEETFYVSQGDVQYFKANYDYQTDWNQTISSHPSYIKNKPSVTDEIVPYSSGLVTSNGIYNALQNYLPTNSLTHTVSSTVNNPISSKGVYDALQNYKATITTDHTVSSTSTNPISSKAVYTALGNNTSISITSLVNATSSGLMTSKGVYSALGNRTKIETEAPTSGSTKLITAGDVYTLKTELDTKINQKVDSSDSARLFTNTEAEKLTNIEENANNYTLPIASADTLGGIKIGNNLSISSDGTLSAIGGGEGSVDGVVLYNKEQSLTDNQKNQARNNIGAAPSNNVYTKTEVDTKLETKADLINGKISTSQIPDDIVNHKQVQADYAQNDSSKSDYIKNKPTKVSEFINDVNYQTAQQITNTLANYSTTQQMNNALSNKSDTGHNHNISDLTGTASVERGGTGYSSIVDTSYTTARYRASSLHTSETNPSDSGIIAWQYG